ncbi:hypothetical protein JQ594_28390 [Bradyrhizobium manausense]|uniref:hypothetical protein n=1 Tax=Bradyrhizobium manausense TaxID=989370 RepID=UPI001BA6EB11|nr:hypothetical protein [Bradyrhizobium manausense]MBR0689862.1 hypothetical protein [Bradyrhizobium manausense]
MQMANLADQYPKPFNDAVAAMITAVGGEDNVQTIALSEQVLIHRRRDGARWRNPVNGRRGFKTSTFLSSKMPGRRIQLESGGEEALFMWAEVYASIIAYTEQSDLIEIVDDEGAAWSVTDCFAELNCGTTAWLEGKYAARLVYESEGPPRVVLGLDPDTTHRAARFAQAFAKAGYSYVLINELWCRHPNTIKNVEFAFAAKVIRLTREEEEAIIRLVRDNDGATIGHCAALFATEDCPTEKVFAAVAQGLLEIDFDEPFSLANSVMLPRQAYWLRRSAQ